MDTKRAATAAILAACLASAGALRAAAADRTMKSCMASASLDGILHSSWDFESLELTHSLEFYYTCLALTADAESECGPLKAAAPSPPQTQGGRGDFYNFCRKAYLRLRLGQDLISRSPRLRDTLKRSVSTRSGRSEADVERMTQAVLEHADDPAKACPEIGGFFEKFPSDCATFMGLSTGRLDCGILERASQPHMEPERFLCAADAAYRKAFAAKSPTACGGNPACLAMMGNGAAACGPLAEAAKRAYCVEWTRPKLK